MPASVLHPILTFVMGTLAGVLLICVITAVLWLGRAIQIRPLHNGISSTMSSRDRNVTNPFWLFIFAGVEELFARSFLIGWLGHYTGLVSAFAI